MAFKLLDKATAVTCSNAVHLAQNVKDHTVSVLFDNRGMTVISVLTAKLQGSLTGWDKDTGIVSTPTIAIDTTATRYSNTAFTYRIQGVSYNVIADAAGQVFTAAHVIGNGTDDLYGAIGLYINTAGVFISKVPMSPQVYTTAELALDALEAMVVPDGLCYIGKILIRCTAKTWTANSSDLTDASGVTTAIFSSAVSTFYDLQSYTLSAAELVAKQAMFAVVNKPVSYVRIFLSALTGTGEITARYTPGGI